MFNNGEYCGLGYTTARHLNDAISGYNSYVYMRNAYGENGAAATGNTVYKRFGYKGSESKYLKDPRNHLITVGGKIWDKQFFINNDTGIGREIIVPEAIYGQVDGKEKILAPQSKWFSYQGNENVVDSSGRIKIVVGPKVLDENYSDKGKILADDFEFPVYIDVVLVNKETGDIKILECIVRKGGKAHTYNTYPDGHERNQYYVDGEAWFDIESGLYQTGIVYPNATNKNYESQLAYGNMDGSTIEFVGKNLGFDPNAYYLKKVIVL